MNTILIVTNSKDIHADYMIPILEKKNQPFFRINLDRFPCDYKLSHICSNTHLSICIEDISSHSSIELCDVTAIWNRKPASFTFRSKLGVQELAFAKQETEHALFSLLYPLNCYWVSHPVALRGAAWKGEQLIRAKKLGFQIPKSLITNCPDEVRSFQSELAGEMIFKALSTPDLAGADVSDADCIADGLSTVIVDEEMMGNLDAVREVPCHFQEYIPKMYELRVTIVGDRVFAAKIHSQDDERTKVDSRDMSAEILYEPTELPLPIKERCLELVHSYGLNYSAMDIIVTPNEEYVFLENNPNGQFLYIEQLIPEFNIMETMADTLIEGAKCRA